MNLKNKLNPQNMRANEWIMNSPEALVVLILMGSGIGFLFFGVFSTALGFARNWFLLVLFGVFSLLSLKQFINICKMVKKFGLKDARGGFTCSGYIWKRDKNWKKIDGGLENGYDRTEQTDEVCNEQDGRSNEIGKEGDGADNSESERTNAWSRIMLERSGSNVDKDGVSKGGNA